MFKHNNYGNFLFQYRLGEVSYEKLRYESLPHSFCILFMAFAVTSVQFNPVNDQYFISGSIDGKVRIWAVESSLVVDWTDIRDIVTAVCYRPNGEVIMCIISHYLGKNYPHVLKFQIYIGQFSGSSCWFYIRKLPLL